MTICKKSNVIFADFPTPLERKLLDLPLPEDDELTVPPFDSFNPFGSRARSPIAAREGAPATLPPKLPEPRFFRDALETAVLLLVLALGAGLPFLAFYVMG